MARDEFSAETKDVLAQRAGMRCSCPKCERLTTGPREDSTKAVNVGVAAHIYAAAPGGPRYDPEMTAEQRRLPENGIWLCQTHAKLIDNDEDRYTASLLREWKREREQNALAEVEGRRALKVEARAPEAGHVDHVPFDNRAGAAAHDGGFNEVSTFFLLAFPVEAAEIPDIHGGPATPIIQLLANPPSLRSTGFDLTVGGEVRVVRSGLRRLCLPGQMLLELHRDGALIFLANAWNALCYWGDAQQDPTDPLRINPLGLAETTYNFVELSRCVSEYLRPPSRGFGFDLGMWRMEYNGHRASLGPGSLRDRAYQRRRGFRPARETSHLVRFDWLTPTIDVGIIVYRLLEEFYAWFGLTSDDVPYSMVKEPGQRRIDPELFKRDR